MIEEVVQKGNEEKQNPSLGFEFSRANNSQLETLPRISVELRHQYGIFRPAESETSFYLTAQFNHSQ